MKVNVNAKILGLVLGILALIAALFVGLIGGLLSIFSLAAGGFGGLWLIGTLIALVGYIMSAIAGFQMYGGNRAGKNLMIYGLLVLFAGAVVGAIGRIVAYSGIIGFGAGYALGGAIVGLRPRRDHRRNPLLPRGGQPFSRRCSTVGEPGWLWQSARWLWQSPAATTAQRLITE